ncbi:MAG: alginate export family protein [Cytophagaceae bacterium]
MATLLVLLISNSTQAQFNNSDTTNQLTIKAQIRPRTEFRNGAFRPLAYGEHPALLVSQRSRITINYTHKNIFSMEFSPQVVSIWGQDPMIQGTTTGNGLALFEAWVKLRTGNYSLLQVGRQTIGFDDERVMGAFDWAQGARAHDAISYKRKKNNLEAQVHAVYNQNYKTVYGNNLNNPTGTLFNPKDASPYKWMQNLWIKYTIKKQNNISLFVNNLGFQNAKNNADDSAKTYFTQTFGGNYFHTGSKWNYNVSVYYQTGKNQSGLTTNAYLIATNIEKIINKQWRAALGGDFLSGNNANGQTSQKNHAFMPYFGTNHKFYGSMDYYYTTSGHKNTGLNDFYVRASYLLENKLKATLTAHQFLSPVVLKNQLTRYSQNLGQEIDLELNYILHNHISITGGYSIYHVTASTRFLKDITSSNPFQHWAWCQLNVNAEILKMKL